MSCKRPTYFFSSKTHTHINQIPKEINRNKSNNNRKSKNTITLSDLMQTEIIYTFKTMTDNINEKKKKTNCCQLYMVLWRLTFNCAEVIRLVERRENIPMNQCR